MRLLSKTGPNLACLLLLTHASFLFLSHIPSISIVLSHLRVGVEIWHRGRWLSSAMMQQIRSSQAEMWLKKQSKFHMRLLSKTGPNLACLLLLTHASFLFLSHIPSISIVLSHLRVGVEIWHRGSDSVVLWCNKFAPAKLRCVEETIEVPHEIAEQDWTKFGLFASSHTCLLSIPFPYSKHQHRAVALAGGCWNLTSG